MADLSPLSLLPCNEIWQRDSPLCVNLGGCLRSTMLVFFVCVCIYCIYTVVAAIQDHHAFIHFSWKMEHSCNSWASKCCGRRIICMVTKKNIHWISCMFFVQSTSSYVHMCTIESGVIEMKARLLELRGCSVLMWCVSLYISSNIIPETLIQKLLWAPHEKYIQYNSIYNPLSRAHIHTVLWAACVRQDPACCNRWLYVLFHTFLSSRLCHWCRPTVGISCVWPWVIHTE